MICESSCRAPGATLHRSVSNNLLPTGISGVSALRGELVAARRETDGLFQLLAPDAVYERPIADRHRLIFYLGHVEAFDRNLLARAVSCGPSLHSSLDRLFERGIDPVPGTSPADTPADWPAREEVDRYCDRTREWVDGSLANAEPWVVRMAIEHRQMHAETLAYLLHQLPYDRKKPGLSRQPEFRSAPANPLIDVPAGMTTPGSSTEDFGWDNEFRRHEVFVPAYQMSRFKISNGEYLEFVHDGGPVPPFWRQSGGQWFFRGMFQELPLPLDWPVWCTWRHATAFAEWRGLTLPSEAQWHRAASCSHSHPELDNFNGLRWDPVAIDAGRQTDFLPTQLTGNGWEWTRDVFAPFEGFEPHLLYPGYSADFFDGQHYVLKGASPRTAQRMARPGFRNWFRPDYPYVYAGFRVVRN